jgi:hypothetical protein
MSFIDVSYRNREFNEVSRTLSAFPVLNRILARWFFQEGKLSFDQFIGYRYFLLFKVHSLYTAKHFIARRFGRFVFQ